MANYTDLSEDNGWIPVQSESEALLRDVEVSAVEAVGRKVNMTTRTVTVPRYQANGVSVVPEHAEIPFENASLDEVTLVAHKWAGLHAISEEDRADAIADELNSFKSEWTSNFNIAFDNACLGVTGTGGPYESVYRAVGSGNRTQTAGNLSYEDLVDVVGDLEGNRKGGLVIIAHPSFKMQLRNLKDADGERVVSDPFGAAVPSAFGNNVYFSYGAATSAAYSDQPAGNPLLIVANRSQLIVGVRSGPESQISDGPQFTTDHVTLKMRARRGFVLADSNAARVIELTAGA
jgi:HK97 family phage major capsid protein